ncbi:hypothetical protein NCAS_0H00730 [Naumovozyma castellii]|uniref:Uncharacterized protein n=1 Tax=Naumovozyma castellii TaxID=27288 RepID=G0VIQ7_NAUCA|nr:hypothetical protein NCAS_0H00730 [Naumovozyma castellii CBS 4309]CCC71383.1 hypothetical protein NCAS_0H00730 [Naumovozyma castellii CBS 4309]
MSSLKEVYDLISQAELETRNGNLNVSINKYKNALSKTNCLLKMLKSEDVENDVTDAILMLRKDISKTIFELEDLVSKQRPDSKVGTVKNPTMLSSLAINPSMNVLGFSKTWDSTVNTNTNLERINPYNDPILRSITDKLQTNLLNLVSDNVQVFQKGDKEEFLQTITFAVEQNFDIFRKELGFYEQKKFTEYDSNLENALKENKKLTNQISKLKERWDSLVESARQKKKQVL